MIEFFFIVYFGLNLAFAMYFFVYGNGYYEVNYSFNNFLAFVVNILFGMFVFVYYLVVDSGFYEGLFRVVGSFGGAGKANKRFISVINDFDNISY